MNLGTRFLRTTGFALALSIAAAAAASSCSTAPKRAAEVVGVKNDAAEYAKLAAGFLAAGKYASALQYYGEALNANMSVDNVDGAISSRSSLGRVYLALKQFDDAERELGDALMDARALGKPVLIASCLSNAGELRYAKGDPAAAEALFAEAEPLAAGDDAIAAVISHNRGIAAMARADYPAAVAFLMKAAGANERGKRWVELGSDRYALASVANAQADIPGAIAWAKKALDADKAAENSRGIGADLMALAALTRKSGDEQGSFDLYRRAFGVWLSLDDAAEAERCLVALTDLSARLGKEAYAARYAALLERIRAK